MPGTFTAAPRQAHRCHFGLVTPAQTGVPLLNHCALYSGSDRLPRCRATILAMPGGLKRQTTTDLQDTKQRLCGRHHKASTGHAGLVLIEPSLQLTAVCLLLSVPLKRIVLGYASVSGLSSNGLCWLSPIEPTCCRSSPGLKSWIIDVRGTGLKRRALLPLGRQKPPDVVWSTTRRVPGHNLVAGCNSPPSFKRGCLVGLIGKQRHAAATTEPMLTFFAWPRPDSKRRWVIRFIRPRAGPSIFPH